MYYLGTTAERAAIEAQMKGSYRMRSRAHLVDLNHKFIRDISGVRLGGDVAVDSTQPITRSLSLEVFDPSDVLGLESSKTGFTAPTLMVQVWKDIHVTALNRWVEIPVFCGPITKPSRNGWTLQIEGQDKGALASYETAGLTLRKGTNAGKAIRLALAHVGETRFRLGTTTATLRRDYVIGGEDNTPLTIARQIAASIGWVLFYDGAGYAVGRPQSTETVFTFETGNDGTLVSDVSTGYWDTDTVNRLYVNGGMSGGKQVSAMATLNINHELSSENLARNGIVHSGYRIAHAEDQPGLLTVKDLSKWVEERLYQLVVQSRTVSFDSRPIWHLQEHDYYRVEDHIDAVYTAARVAQMSIPLAADGVQSNGYLRRTGNRFGPSRVYGHRRVTAEAKAALAQERARAKAKAKARAKARAKAKKK